MGEIDPDTGKTTLEELRVKFKHLIQLQKLESPQTMFSLTTFNDDIVEFPPVPIGDVDVDALFASFEPERGTALFEALRVTLNDIYMMPVEVEKVVIVATDGLNNEKAYARYEASNLYEKASTYNTTILFLGSKPSVLQGAQDALLVPSDRQFLFSDLSQPEQHRSQSFPEDFVDAVSSGLNSQRTPMSCDDTMQIPRLQRANSVL
jgi:hypothetical protein